MNESTPRTQGRPKDPEKRAAIMQAASKLFLEQGFDRTSMDAVATEAGVSKLTVYSHFENKETLFRTLVTCKCHEFLHGNDFGQLAALAPDEAIYRVARGFLDLMFHPDVLALHRLLFAGLEHGSALADMFYESGPQPALAGFSKLLATYHTQGRMRVPDPFRAADAFYAMLRGDLFLRALLQLNEHPSTQALDDHAHFCTGLFCTALVAR